jgi:hypothetical protein
MSLMELNPLGRWTVKIATRSTTIIGTVATGKGASEDQQSADDLNDDGRPAQQIRERHADGMQNCDEFVRTPGKLCVAVLDEAETDDKPERYGIPARWDGKRRQGEPGKKGTELHT